MRTTYLTALCLLAATAGPALAQETTDTEAMADEVMEEAVEEMADEVMEDAMADDAMADDAMADDTMADEAMADDAMADDVMEEPAVEEDMSDDTMSEEAMAEDTMTDEVMEDATPSLEDIAASDPALAIREGADGEADAMVMLSDVLFSFADASLEPAALEVLAGVADKLDGVLSIEITGHTDAIGDDEFNLALGQRRADAVRDWLIANTALTADVVTARGVGEADPIAENRTEAGADNPEGRALNRRVEFTLPDAG